MKKQNSEIELIIGIVRESLLSVPDFEETVFEVDSEHIHSTELRGKRWWKVPIVPNPWPRRKTLLYEALSEIEERIEEEKGLDISMYLGGADPLAA